MSTITVASRVAAVTRGRSTTLVGLTVAAWLVCGFAGSGFLSPFNLNSLGQVVAQTAMIGLAQAAVMVMGRINLAVGGIGVLVVMVIGISTTSWGVPLGVGLVLGLVVGIVAALLIAAVELVTGLNSFVVSLAFLSVYQGGVLLWTQAVHYPVSSPQLQLIGNGSLGSSYLSPLLAITVVTAVVLWLFYGRTCTGATIRALGANERAAEASALPVRRSLFAGYAVCGLLCGLAGIMEVARLAEASPSTGTDWLLLSFIGPLLAGISLTGGEIAVGSIVLGSAFYASIFSGLVILDVPTYWLTLAQALVLLGALILGQCSNWLTSRGLGLRSGSHA